MGEKFRLGMLCALLEVEGAIFNGRRWEKNLGMIACRYSWVERLGKRLRGPCLGEQIGSRENNGKMLKKMLKKIDWLIMPL